MASAGWVSCTAILHQFRGVPRFPHRLHDECGGMRRQIATGSPYRRASYPLDPNSGCMSSLCVAGSIHAQTTPFLVGMVATGRQHGGRMGAAVDNRAGGGGGRILPSPTAPGNLISMPSGKRAAEEQVGRCQKEVGLGKRFWPPAALKHLGPAPSAAGRGPGGPGEPGCWLGLEAPAHCAAAQPGPGGSGEHAAVLHGTGCHQAAAEAAERRAAGRGARRRGAPADVASALES